MSCPICGKDTAPKFRPFCSKRCADIDLSKWFSGSYAIPSEDPEDVERAIEEIEHEMERASQKPH
ncbi:DNA gyrase inhibitor YacG [Lutimaribacter sp. EGI FJ00015]|uniref:DNA gyrase inhibitor YacG n=1 Tax=Lutimaribacter degradans TaxID=2945989 RepID=A0ACC5ZTU9_9RHOB|nr:DNA gyrase inhibitor YacG [Lutimaribacter sp. EGI FJ00013]MCM2561466.1 DNA gyrase inhibitor YacG [Lutimaribacter sp. EGI FJ00013]MCO0612823.1 DNA gyrase inhibitor YacG [Lutimaribacter sp. EGI FJ00015]MCO0635481.1 DNA gyrase inhibitor YacG [Lutimaribacter sp. EGI FJ00014]